MDSELTVMEKIATVAITLILGIAMFAILVAVTFLWGIFLT